MPTAGACDFCPKLFHRRLRLAHTMPEGDGGAINPQRGYCQECSSPKSISQQYSAADQAVGSSEPLACGFHVM